MASTDPPPITAERERVLRLARRVVDGDISPRDGAAEISAPVDPAGGRGALDREHSDLYIDFYGLLSAWEDSEIFRKNAVPSALAVVYEDEIRQAARHLLSHQRAS